MPGYLGTSHTCCGQIKQSAKPHYSSLKTVLNKGTEHPMADNTGSDQGRLKIVLTQHLVKELKPAYIKLAIKKKKNTVHNNYMTICGHLVTALMDLWSGSLLLKAAQVNKTKQWELMSHINTPIKQIK